MPCRRFKGVIDAGVPTFGICLGHQMLGLALGGKTMKMHQGHHGANHPVKDLTTGKVEITSMNHGFAVDSKSLPEGVEETHVSLFDGSNCGLRRQGQAGVRRPVPPGGLARPARLALPLRALRRDDGGEAGKHHVVCVDYGIKRNILRLLADHGCRVTVLPASATAEDILAHKPDGVFLSNGPGDPAATGAYAVPAIQGRDRRPACRPSASASATRCSASRSAARR